MWVVGCRGYWQPVAASIHDTPQSGERHRRETSRSELTRGEQAPVLLRINLGTTLFL